MSFLCRRVADRAGWYGREMLNPSYVYLEMTEVFQRFFKPEERQMIIGLGLRGMSYYSDVWKWDSGWKIRQYKNAYAVWGWISRKQDILPMLKQRGLKRMSDDSSPYEQIEKVMSEYQAEVLLKAGAHGKAIYDAFMGRDSYKVRVNWEYIRIALRHKYRISDTGMWFDLLDLLKANGKDVRNPHYICPANLKKAHDEQHAIRQRVLEKARIERERKEAERLAEKLSEDGKTNLEYVEKMGALLGVTVKSGDMVMKPLQSIREFFDEGSELAHCVFTNKYYKHDHCLIIGARVEGKRTETIEIDTKEWKIVQCRGKHNQPSKYHDRILRLMNKNMDKFRRVAL